MKHIFEQIEYVLPSVIKFNGFFSTVTCLNIDALVNITKRMHLKMSFKVSVNKMWIKISN